MWPKPSVHYATNRHVGDSIFDCKIDRSFACGHSSADVFDLGGIKHGTTVVFTPMKSLTLLHHHVSHVVSLGALEEMIRTHAGIVVTRMTDFKRGIGFSVSEHERQTVHSVHHATDTKATIAILAL